MEGNALSMDLLLILYLYVENLLINTELVFWCGCLGTHGAQQSSAPHRRSFQHRLAAQRRAGTWLYAMTAVAPRRVGVRGGGCGANMGYRQRRRRLSSRQRALAQVRYVHEVVDEMPGSGSQAEISFPSSSSFFFQGRNPIHLVVVLVNCDGKSR
jgi:hypothetical protein